MAYCVPDHNNHRNLAWKGVADYEQVSQTRMWHCCQTFIDSGMALRRFFGTGKLKGYGRRQEVRGSMYPGDDSPQVKEQRVLICMDVAHHLDVEFLKMLLPDVLDQTSDRLAEIKEQVDAISGEDILKSRGEDSPWTGIGIVRDCHEGIMTNKMTEEQLAADLAKGEAEEEEVGG